MNLGCGSPSRRQTAYVSEKTFYKIGGRQSCRRPPNCSLKFSLECPCPLSLSIGSATSSPFRDVSTVSPGSGDLRSSQSNACRPPSALAVCASLRARFQQSGWGAVHACTITNWWHCGHRHWHTGAFLGDSHILANRIRCQTKKREFRGRRFDVSLRREPCKNETLLYQMGVHFKR